MERSAESARARRSGQIACPLISRGSPGAVLFPGLGGLFRAGLAAGKTVPLEVPTPGAAAGFAGDEFPRRFEERQSDPRSEPVRHERLDLHRLVCTIARREAGRAVTIGEWQRRGNALHL